MIITTNNQERESIYGYDLTDEEKKEFDYLEGDDLEYGQFFRYKGRVFDIGEFVNVPKGSELSAWHGYRADTFFSGTVIKICEGGESVIVGTYFS